MAGKESVSHQRGTARETQGKGERGREDGGGMRGAKKDDRGERRKEERRGITVHEGVER